MNNADMMIHVHPELSVLERNELERKLSGRIGVDCAEFSHHPHSHALMVKYDPDTLQGLDILQVVRRLDPSAMMVGL